MYNNLTMSLESQFDEAQRKIDSVFDRIETLYREASAEHNEKICAELTAQMRELCKIQAELDLVKEFYKTYSVA